MTSLTPPKNIYIKKSSIAEGGRGVYAAEKIAADSCIEQCPVTTLAPAARKRLRKTGLVNYYFLWRGDDSEKVNVSICFGYGSIYNHSFTPNARYIHNPEDGRMDFYALRDIAPDEEIFVNYNGEPDDTRPLNIPGIPDSKTPDKLQLGKRIFASVQRRLELVASWAKKLISE